MSNRILGHVTRLGAISVVVLLALTVVAPVALGRTESLKVEPTAYVTASRLNVRSGPSYSYSVVTTVDRHQGIPLVGRNQDGSWMQIRLPGGYAGWVDASYLQSDFNSNNLPTTFDSAALSVQPHITLSDGVANPGKSISVLVEGFAANQAVNAYLYSADAGMKEQIASVTTNGGGTAQLDITMPSTWPNGNAITQSNVVLVISTADGQVNETANLQYVFGDEMGGVPSVIDTTFTAMRAGDTNTAKANLTGAARDRADFTDTGAFQNLTGLQMSPEAITGLGSRVIEVNGGRVKAETVLISNDQYIRLIVNLLQKDGRYLIDDVYMTGQYTAADTTVVG